MPRRSKVEELKNLLSGNTLSTLSMVGFEEIATGKSPRNDAHNIVILNEVKNLSESADVRLLCYPVDASRCSA